MVGQISSKNNSIQAQTSVLVSSPQPLPHMEDWIASFYIALFKSVTMEIMYMFIRISYLVEINLV